MEDIEATYKDQISQDPAVMVGKPVVKGTRIPVELVLGHLAHNPDLADLFATYPHLALEDVGLSRLRPGRRRSTQPAPARCSAYGV